MSDTDLVEMYTNAPKAVQIYFSECISDRAVAITKVLQQSSANPASPTSQNLPSEGISQS